MYTYKKKKMLFVHFIIHYFPCVIFKKETFQIYGNYPFSQKYFHTQAKNIFQFLKDLKKNEDVSFSKFLNFLNLDENTYTLSSRSK
jgi:hypothetical protein